MAYVFQKSDRGLVWVILAASGRFADAERFDVPISAECPSCSVRAVVELPRPVLEKQPDGTTHVCHPALGGCNLGYEKGDQWLRRVAWQTLEMPASAIERMAKAYEKKGWTRGVEERRGADDTLLAVTLWRGPERRRLEVAA